MEQNQEQNKQKSGNKRFLRWGGLGVLLVSVGSKLKALLPLLKLGKFGGTFLTMLVSVWAYALAFSWQFSLGLVLMIFIHEMGHVLAARQKGLPASAPAFIPFVGALIMLKRQPQDAETEAYVAYGGPLVGTLGAMLCYGIGVWTGNGLYYAIAFIGFLLNLFNLLPIHPLDGGRIAVAITRWLWALGLVLGLILIIYLQSILLIIIYLLFVWEMWATFRNQREQTVEKEIEFPPTVFQEAEAILPGEDHKRTLSFVQYCDCKSEEHFLEIQYPGVGTFARLSGIKDGVQDIELVRTQAPNLEHANVRMTLKMTIIPQTALEKNEKYYQVAAKKRWGYGIAYVGLAIFLIYMMFMSRTVIQSPVLVG